MKTKRLIYLLAACFISSLVILQTGCKKNEEEEPPSGPEPVVLTDNAKILDEATWEESYVSIDSSDYTVTFNNNIESLNLEVGDVMVSGAGNGMLRKVTSITPVKGEVIVETEQASMEDMIESGDVIFEMPLEVESAKFNYPGISLKKNNLKQPGSTEFTITINHTFAPDVTIQGYCTFNFTLITSLHYTWHSGLTYAKFGFVSDQVFELSITSEAGFQGEIDLGEVLFGGNDPELEFPCAVQPQFEILLGVNVSANATLSSGVYESLHFAAGVEYTNGWGSYCTFNDTFTPFPPTISVGLDAKAYFKPKLSCLFYDVAAPYLSAEAYVKAHGQLDVPQWAAYVGYSIDAGIDIEIFSHTVASVNYNIKEDEWLIIKGPTPTVKTNDITNIILASAKGGGDVTDEGSSSVTECGICWSPSHDPTIADSSSHSSSGGAGSYTCDIANLSPATKYYVRAYATNSHGTDYGEEKYFTSSAAIPCPGIPTVTYEGHTYHTVLINNQCWFNENLNVGTMINVANDQANNGQIEKYCLFDDPVSCETYGGLYQWNELMQYTTSQGTQGICPPGWHIPTDAEWTSLTDYLGGEPVAGGKMKEAGITHWSSPNSGATNQSGFAALPGGVGGNFGGGGNGDFWDWSSRGHFWTSTQIDADNAWQRILSSDNTAATRPDQNNNKFLGFSVRCVKN